MKPFQERRGAWFTADSSRAVLWLVIRLILWLIVVGVGLWLVVNIQHTLLIFGAAFAITLALAPLVQFTARCRVPWLKRPLSWGASVAVVYLVVTFLLVISVVAAVPVVGEQARTIASDIPLEMPRLQATVDDWQLRFTRWKLPPKMKENFENYVHDGVEKIGALLERGFEWTATGIVNTFSFLVVALAAYIIAVFLLLQYPTMSSQFYAILPEPYRTDMHGLVKEMNQIFGGFVRGMGLLAFLVGVVNFVCLSLLGLLAAAGVDGLQPFQYTILVSVLSMVGYLVPILGIAVTSLVAGLLAWFQYPSAYYVLVVVLILFVGSNAVDRILGPKIMSKTMGVSPLFVMFAAFAGAELCGFWGMILGVPAAAAVKAVWNYLYHRFLTAEELPAIQRVEVEVDVAVTSAAQPEVTQPAG